MGSGESTNNIEQKKPTITLYKESEDEVFAIPKYLDGYIGVKLISTYNIKELNNNKSDNDVLIYKVGSIQSEKVEEYLAKIYDITQITQPLVIFVVDNNKELTEQFDKLIKEKELNRKYFYIENNTEKDLGHCLQKLIKYHNELDDDYIFEGEIINNNLNDNSTEINKPGKDGKDKSETNEEPLSLEEINNREFMKTNRMNLFIIGRTGSGKSTFINRIFNDQITKETQGNNMTSKVLCFNYPNKILTLYDTPGFTLQNVKEQLTIFKPYFNQIKQQTLKLHGVLVLINAQTRTILNNDMLIIKEFVKLKVPIFFILNKCVSPKDGQNRKDYLINDIRQLFKGEEFLNGLNDRIFPINLFTEKEQTIPLGMHEMFLSLQSYYEQYVNELQIIKQLDTIELKRSYYQNSSLLEHLKLNNHELSNVDNLITLYAIGSKNLGGIDLTISLNS